MSRRVVVTGIGLVSSLGVGTEPTWQGLCEGRSGIGPITHFDASQFAARIAGEVKGFDPLQFVEKKDVKKLDVFIQYALAASEFAVTAAALKVEPAFAARVGVFIASGIGGFSTIEREHRALLEGGASRPSSSRPRSSTWRLGTCRSASGRGGRTPPRARRAPPRRTPSATPSRSSAAATPTR